VQTFLPYPDFARSASVLDDRRLGKQRVEVLQIIRALTIPGYGWRAHPAALMWKGHEEALVAYGATICAEWRRRGFADTCEAKILADAGTAGIRSARSQEELAAGGLLPPWLGDEDLHRSHRSALLRKDPDRYRPLFGDEPADLSYVWPVPAVSGSRDAAGAPTSGTSPPARRRSRRAPPDPSAAPRSAARDRGAGGAARGG
jgi:hypothetical protein